MEFSLWENAGDFNLGSLTLLLFRWSFPVILSFTVHEAIVLLTNSGFPKPHPFPVGPAGIWQWATNVSVFFLSWPGPQEALLLSIASPTAHPLVTCLVDAFSFFGSFFHIIISTSNVFSLYLAPEVDVRFALTGHKHGSKVPVAVSKGCLIIIFKCLFLIQRVN